MRFSGSIYDNLRQPGVFTDLQQKTGGDRSRMKRAVLARLRLDDLLSNDSTREDDARVVASFSDIVDGRLFTLFVPEDLKGIELEILCPETIARDPGSAVVRSVRGWIQNADGKGRPVFFMAAPEGSTRQDIASQIKERNDLDVRSLRSAVRVLVGAGLSKQDGDELEGHWRNWDRAIRKGLVRLKPYPGKPASAAPALRSFLERNKSALWEYGIGEAGEDVFSRALECLESSQGRRDEPVRFLNDQIASSGAGDSIKDEVERVKDIFFHHMFEAIAQGNYAVPEHSARVGDNDNYALPTHYLDTLESFEEDRSRIALDARIVSGLGAMDASEYHLLRGDIAWRVGRAVEQFRQNRDLSELNAVFGRLAFEVGTGHYIANEGTEDAVRRFVWPATGAVLGAALEAYLAPGSNMMRTAVAVAAGSIAVTAVEEAASKMTASIPCSLLKRSLVRTAIRELTTPERYA